MSDRILVIEDNPANLELMSYLLNAFGYELLTATDGRTGLEIARREAPDLIICDIQLPEISGFEVVRQLKAEPRLCAIPVIGVTAFAMVGDRDKVLAAGFDDYVSKPIDPETFVSRIAARLQRPSNEATFDPNGGDTSVASRTAPGGFMVLVVDNWPDNLALARSILEPHGYGVRTANEPAAALAALRERTCDLILSDVCMGKESGFDLIQAVKAEPRWRAIPFIFLSSTFMDESDRRYGLELGAAKFLRRPMEPDELLHEIASCLGEKA